MSQRSILHVSQILEWADSHHQRTGAWPQADSGPVPEAMGEKWCNIDTCLRQGLRGLRPGSSIARLLAKHRGKRNRKRLPSLTERKILAWADSYRDHTGRWPHHFDGAIEGSDGETWCAVDVALRAGQRGLPGGSSLALLLLAKRRAIHRTNRPKLNVREILSWADDHYRRTGSWPTEGSGPIPLSQGDTWQIVAKALRNGRRGLRASSLASILSRQRGVAPKHRRRPPLTIAQILAWADAHHAKTGRWPIAASGVVVGQPHESWFGINQALLAGMRGLPGSLSLTELLIEHRGVRNHLALPPLDEAQILRWARQYQRQHGRWPNRYSGLIPGSGGEVWSGVHNALVRGRRSLKRRMTLRQLIDSQT